MVEWTDPVMYGLGIAIWAVFMLGVWKFGIWQGTLRILLTFLSLPVCIITAGWALDNMD